MFLLKELPSDEIMSAYARRYREMDKAATRRALEMLQSASFLLRDLEKLFSQHGLSQTRFLILIVLEREGGRLTGRQIRDRIDISRPVLTTTLKGLKREGCIGLDEVEQDARAVEAVLLEAGRAKLTALLPAYFTLVSQAGSRMLTT